MNNNITRRFMAVSLLFSVISMTLLPMAQAGEELKLGGSGSCLGTMRLLAEQFQKTHPDVRITVVPSLGSSGGIKAVAAGALDIGLSGRPLKEEERRLGVTAIEYGRTPFVIATGASNATSSINIEQLAQMYAGKLTVWPDGKPLRLVLRPASESDNEILKGMSPAMNKAVSYALGREGMTMALTDQDSADAIEKITGAVGNSTLALILSERRPLKVLALNGVTPSPEAIADGVYPYYKTMFMVMGSKTSQLARDFIGFVRSPEGRNILTQNGHWIAE